MEKHVSYSFEVRKLKFIKVTTGNYKVLHGFNEKNEEILEDVKVSATSKKLISIDRIKSISHNFLLTDYANGRWIYWEYEEEFDDLVTQLGVSNVKV